jgi:hypothetical protein
LSQASELAVAGFVDGAVGDFTNQTNGYSILQQLGVFNQTQTAFVQQIVNSTAAQSCQVTSPATCGWAAALATYKGA